MDRWLVKRETQAIVVTLPPIWIGKFLENLAIDNCQQASILSPCNMQYDVDRIFGAFQSLKRYRGLTFPKLAQQCGIGLATAHSIVNTGRGTDDYVDRVAKALGFAGREDVMIQIAVTRQRSA